MKEDKLLILRECKEWQEKYCVDVREEVDRILDDGIDVEDNDLNEDQKATLQKQLETMKNMDLKDLIDSLWSAYNSVFHSQLPCNVCSHGFTVWMCGNAATQKNLSWNAESKELLVADFHDQQSHFCLLVVSAQWNPNHWPSCSCSFSDDHKKALCMPSNFCFCWIFLLLHDEKMGKREIFSKRAVLQKRELWKQEWMLWTTVSGLGNIKFLLNIRAKKIAENTQSYSVLMGSLPAWRRLFSLEHQTDVLKLHASERASRQERTPKTPVPHGLREFVAICSVQIFLNFLDFSPEIYTETQKMPNHTNIWGPKIATKTRQGNIQKGPNNKKKSLKIWYGRLGIMQASIFDAKDKCCRRIGILLDNAAWAQQTWRHKKPSCMDSLSFTR